MCTSDYDIPPSSSVCLISPTSSFDSSAEVPLDVRDTAIPPSPSPAPGFPSHQPALDVVLPTPRPSSLEVKAAVSPPKAAGSPGLSGPLVDCTPASNYSDSYPPVSQLDQSDAVNSSPAVCGPLSTDPPCTPPPAACPVDLPVSPDLPPTSCLSVSPSDSPSQRRLLIGPSPPPIPPDADPPSGRPTHSLRFPQRVPSKSSLPATKRLSRQRLPRKRLSRTDLRHHLIAGAVPCNAAGDVAEADSQSCYLKGHHDHIVKLKSVCRDSDSTSSPPSPSPPPAANVRRIVIRDSSPPPSPVLVPSSSPSSPCPADNLAIAENAEFALKVLRETFYDHSPAPSPPRAPSTAGLAHSSVNSEKLTESPILLDDPPSISTRLSSPVAPPPPVSKQLHPARSSFHPASHCQVFAANVVPGPSVSGMVAGLLNQIRRESPPSSPPPADTDNVAATDQNNCADATELDPIPSAQPRRSRSPDIAADPPAHPDPPPPPDPDSLDDLDTSQDLLVEPAELDQLNEFRALWIERFNGDSSWEEFSVLCERFAVETKELAQSLSNPMAPKPSAGQSNPPPSPTPHHRPPTVVLSAHSTL